MADINRLIEKLNFTGDVLEFLNSYILDEAEYKKCKSLFYEDFQLFTDAQWRERLSSEEYRVLRQAGTEAPHVGEYVDTKTQGVYSCRACGTELFRSTEKFDSHCGWPSFFSPLAGDRVIEREDRSHGMVRTEVVCANCGSHLGHVFAGEGYDTPTDLRYCINSISLRLVPQQVTEN